MHNSERLSLPPLYCTHVPGSGLKTPKVRGSVHQRCTRWKNLFSDVRTEVGKEFRISKLRYMRCRNQTAVPIYSETI